MSRLRLWLAENPVIIGSVAAVIILIALYFILFSGGSSSIESPKVDYFYDLDSGEVFTDDFKIVPPYKHSSGAEAVKAVVVSCGSCEDESERQVAWLERYTETAKPEMERIMAEVIERGHAPYVAYSRGKMLEQGGGLQVSFDDPIEWFGHTSMAGLEIRSELMSFCGEDEPPTICHPD